jgi:alpha-tubulin suppressor-like RCC1 family protein
VRTALRGQPARAAAGPGPVPERWALIAPGGFHACAIRAGHALWCWGYNATGELGLDSTAEQHRAQQVTR